MEIYLLMEIVLLDQDLHQIKEVLQLQNQEAAMLSGLMHQLGLKIRKPILIKLQQELLNINSFMVKKLGMNLNLIFLTNTLPNSRDYLILSSSYYLI